MSARDTLATLIGDAPWPSSWDRETHLSIADAILAAGWRDPSEPIGYTFTDSLTREPPRGQRFATRVEAAVARDVWEAQWGLKGRFVVCALVPVDPPAAIH